MSKNIKIDKPENVYISSSKFFFNSLTFGNELQIKKFPIICFILIATEDKPDSKSFYFR